MAVSNNKTIEDFCRLCAVESQTGVTIYGSEGENLCLEAKIINCLRIEVTRSDLLPKRVCQACSNLLEDFHQFTTRAIQVQQTLSFLLSLQLRQIQQNEIGSMKQDVKLESYMIKNEQEDLNLQNIQAEQLNRQLLDGYDDLMDDNSHNRTIHRVQLLQPEKTSKQNINVGVMVNNDNSSNEIHDFKHQGEFNDNAVFPAFNNENTDTDKTRSDDNNKEGETMTIKPVTEYLNDNNEYQVEKEWRKHCGILCNECDDVFSDKTLFDDHYRMLHGKQSLYTCSYCKKSTDNYSTYRSHCYKHIYDGRYSCKLCDKKFSMRTMLKIHILSKHASVKPYICEECGKGFVSESKLNIHQKKHCKERKDEFRCLECGKVLRTRGGLAVHMSAHRLGRRFMCDLCGKTFTQKINMQKHVKHHNGERPFHCDQCGKGFTEKGQLVRHKRFHTLDRPFQCQVCNKMYKTERCLKVHSNVHLNNRPYVCSYCGKGFLSSTKLKQHHNCHTGERPYLCKYCDKTFTNYSNWLKHVRRRHKVDHKTGFSLKQDNTVPVIKTQTQLMDDTLMHNSINSVPVDDNIEFIEMPGVEVKQPPNEQDQLLPFMSPFSMSQSPLFSINEASFMSHAMMPL